MTFEIAWNTDTIILAQVEKLFRKVFIEYLAHTNSEAVAHPAINSPIVEHFIADYKRQAPLRISDRMLNQKTIFDILLTSLLNFECAAQTGFDRSTETCPR